MQLMRKSVGNKGFTGSWDSLKKLFRLLFLYSELRQIPSKYKKC